MSGVDALPLVASTVTCEPLHPCNLIPAVLTVGAHALRAFRSNTLVVKRTSRSRHRASRSRVERESSVSGRHSTSHRSRHTTADDASAVDEASQRSRHSRRSRSADESLLSTNSAAAARLDSKARLASGPRSRSSGDAEARTRHRSRSRSGEAGTRGDERSSSSLLAVRKTQSGASDSDALSARTSPALPPLRPPPPAPATVSLGGLTASRLHSNNSSFNSVQGAGLPPMPGKPPLSGQRNGATPRSASAEDGRRSGRVTVGASHTRSSSGGRDRDTHRHRRHHSRTSSRDSMDSNPRDSAAEALTDDPDEGRGAREKRESDDSTRRSHRTSSASRHATLSEVEGSLRVTPAPAKRKPLRQRMAEWDMTHWAYSFTHFVRAFPAKVVHGYCGLQRQLAILPLLRFRDEGAQAHGLLDDCVPQPGESIEETSALYLNPALGLHVFSSREMLRVCGDYVAQCLLMDNSLVIKLLRSRRTSRKSLGWLVRLGAHTIVDPLFLSAVTPLLLVKLRDVEQGERLAQVIRVTRAGVVRGLLVSAVSVVLERVMMPAFSRLVNRAVVTFCESTEYVLLRRYRSWPETSEEDDDDDDEEEEESDAEVDTLIGGAASNADGERRRRRAHRARRERRKRREAREHAAEAAMHRAILRAITYRVAGTLAAQCFIEHPMRMLVELLRNRAVMHTTGLLRMYDLPTSTVAPLAAVVDEAPATTFWSSLFSATPTTSEASPTSAPAVLATTNAESGAADSVPPMVALFRRTGVEVGRECRVWLDTLTDAAGQTDAINQLLQHVQAEREAGGRPTASESTELFVRSLLSLAPLYSVIQVTVLDRLVVFYVEVWTRLTK